MGQCRSVETTPAIVARHPAVEWFEEALSQTVGGPIQQVINPFIIMAAGPQWYVDTRTYRAKQSDFSNTKWNTGYRVLSIATERLPPRIRAEWPDLDKFRQEADSTREVPAVLYYFNPDNVTVSTSGLVQINESRTRGYISMARPKDIVNVG